MATQQIVVDSRQLQKELYDAKEQIRFDRTAMYALTAYAGALSVFLLVMFLEFTLGLL
ncbi:MAG: hypothetical protein JRN39_07715 [Nitrososphaerota archaeon]|nr:hypothetical protein [Nitrososphaerota archaeon]